MKEHNPEAMLLAQIMDAIRQHGQNEATLRVLIASILHNAEVNDAFVALASTKMNWVQG